jgi:hypothetical protein
LDISTLKPKEENEKKASKYIWRMMVFSKVGLKISDVFTTKAAMVDPTLVKLHNMQTNKILPKTLRMDMAGENKKLEEKMDSDQWKIKMKIEYTARDTFQENLPVEVGFATIGGRARRLMMTAANVPVDFKHLLFPEAIMMMATLLDGIIPVKHNGVMASRFIHIMGSDPSFVKYIQTWGEAGTVTIKARKMHPKEADRGVTCIMVGYPSNHAGDCYRMWDPETKRVNESRDVVWLRCMFFTKKSSESEALELGPIRNLGELEPIHVEQERTNEAGEGMDSTEAEQSEALENKEANENDIITEVDDEAVAEEVIEEAPITGI